MLWTAAAKLLWTSVILLWLYEPSLQILTRHVFLVTQNYGFVCDAIFFIHMQLHLKDHLATNHIHYSRLLNQKYSQCTYLGSNNLCMCCVLNKALEKMEVSPHKSQYYHLCYYLLYSVCGVSAHASQGLHVRTILTTKANACMCSCWSWKERHYLPSETSVAVCFKSPSGTIDTVTSPLVQPVTYMYAVICVVHVHLIC